MSVVLMADVAQSLNGAFPIFSSERLMNEALEGFSFDYAGIAEQWAMFDHLSQDVMAFLPRQFPALNPSNCSICCELQLSHLREKITATERAHECYRSILARCSQ